MTSISWTSHLQPSLRQCTLRSLPPHWSSEVCLALSRNSHSSLCPTVYRTQCFRSSLSFPASSVGIRFTPLAARSTTCRHRSHEARHENLSRAPWMVHASLVPRRGGGSDGSAHGPNMSGCLSENLHHSRQKVEGGAHEVPTGTEDCQTYWCAAGCP